MFISGGLICEKIKRESRVLPVSWLWTGQPQIRTLWTGPKWRQTEVCFTHNDWNSFPKLDKSLIEVRKWNLRRVWLIPCRKLNETGEAFMACPDRTRIRSNRHAIESKTTFSQHPWEPGPLKMMEPCFQESESFAWFADWSRFLPFSCSPRIFRTPEWR